MTDNDATDTDVHDRLDRLESLVADQQETIARQGDRIADQRETIETQRERIAALETGDRSEDSEESTAYAGDDPSESDGSLLPVRRRTLLKSAGLAGLLGYGTGQVAADPQGTVGSGEDPVRTVHTEALSGGLTGDSTVDTLAGEGLSISGGALRASNTGGRSLTVSSPVGDRLSGVSELVFSRNLLIEDDGDGTVTVEATDSNTDTDTHTDVSGGGTTVEDVDDVTFAENLDLSDDGDGTATVDGTDTHTDVADDGSTVASDVDEIDFGSSLAVSVGGGTPTVDATPEELSKWEDKSGDTDNLLETSGSETGIDVTDVRVQTVRDASGNAHLTLTDGGPLTVGQPLDLDGSDLEDAGTTIWESSDGYVPQSQLQNDSVTVAGNSVSLGDSTDVDYADLGDTEDSFPIPNGDLANSSVTVSSGNGLTGGGPTSLGGSTTLKVASDSIGTNELDAAAVAGSSLTGDSGTLDLGLTIQTGTVDFRGDSGLQGMKIRGEGGSTNILEIERPDYWDDPGYLRPATDGQIILGNSNKRWGNIYTKGDVNTGSDARLKQNVTDLSDSLDRLRDIRPVSYEWKDTEDPDTRLGFVAQELDDAVPEAVDHPDDEDGYLGVTYSMVLPVAVGAIQAQQEQIDSLGADCDAKDARIADQQERIETLEAENEQLRERNEALEARLDRIEAELGVDADGQRQGVADD
jgi:uncharacterized coiled-coil protein SlyX